MKRFALFLGSLLPLVAANACRSMDEPDASDTGVVSHDVVDATNDTAVDVSSHDVVGADVVATDASDGGAELTVQQVANPMAAGHPAADAGVMIRGPLVALTGRGVTGPSARGNCTYSIWVGDPAGGPYSGIEVVESDPAPVMDGGAACDPSNTGTVIPPNVVIGDQVTLVAGVYDTFCPTGMSCPTGAGMQIFIGHGGGSFVVTNPGTGGASPPPTVATIPDVNGTTMNAPMDLPLQNTLVRIHGAFQQQVPVSGTGGNHSTMLISASASDTTNEIPVSVSDFAHASCVRAALATAGVGASIGDVTGVLTYDFGKWSLHLPESNDITGISANCGSDAGAADASVDAPTGG